MSAARRTALRDREVDPLPPDPHHRPVPPEMQRVQGDARDFPGTCAGAATTNRVRAARRTSGWQVWWIRGVAGREGLASGHLLQRPHGGHADGARRWHRGPRRTPHMYSLRAEGTLRRRCTLPPATKTKRARGARGAGRRCAAATPAVELLQASPRGCEPARLRGARRVRESAV